jgi:hypothetical protein
MIVSRPVTYVGNGAAGGGTLNQLYVGVCIGSNSPGCASADITVATLGSLYGVPVAQTGPGLLGAQSNTVPQPGCFTWSGAW